MPASRYRSIVLCMRKFSSASHWFFLLIENLLEVSHRTPATKYDRYDTNDCHYCQSLVSYLSYLSTALTTAFQRLCPIWYENTLIIPIIPAKAGVALPGCTDANPPYRTANCLSGIQCAICAGRSKANVVPRPGALSARISRPCNSTMRLAMASPNPAPPRVRILSD